MKPLPPTRPDASCAPTARRALWHVVPPTAFLLLSSSKLSSRGGKNAKKRAVVAVARKLAVLLHKLWVSGGVVIVR